MAPVVGHKQDKDAETLLKEFVQNRLPQMPGAEPWVLNEWMDQLANTNSLTVLPFLRAYLNHPQLNTSSVGPNTFRGGGEPPTVLLLLSALARQGSEEARELLSSCLQAKDYGLRRNAPSVVLPLDRTAALDALVEHLKDPDPNAAADAARTLVQFGDARGIPKLIEALEANFPATRSLSFDTLKHYTQEDIPENAPAQWRQWWRANSNHFHVNVRGAQIDSEIFR